MDPRAANVDIEKCGVTNNIQLKKCQASIQSMACAHTQNDTPAYTCIHRHAHTHTHVHIHVHTLAHSRTHTHTNTQRTRHPHAPAHTHTYTHVHKKYTCTHPHTQACMHTQTITYRHAVNRLHSSECQYLFLQFVNNIGRCKEPLGIIQSTVDIGCKSVLRPFVSRDDCQVKMFNSAAECLDTSRAL